jgi:ribulose-5-phosphate 4-epimerase/fuculose-1-phosphate aldolase
VSEHPERELADAARALASAGLVTAFGHVSVRHGEGAMLITPPRPLGTIGPESSFATVPLDAATLPPGVPGEAWIHLAIYRSRPDVGAVCRAQPEVATALAAAGLRLRPIHGQGAFLGREVPVFDDARLIRDRARGEAVAATLGESSALLLRGNGAVTVGGEPGISVARMSVLEAAARLHRDAAAGEPQLLSEDELMAWEGVAEEILGRIWEYLRGNV